MPQYSAISRGVWSCVSSVLFLSSLYSADATTPSRDVFDLSLEELYNTSYKSLGTLAPTTARKAPVTTTVITARDIELTPHRNLLDLIEVYVPGAMVLPHSEGRMLGMRGIVSDRNLKFLVLLNGRNMNQKSHGGAYTELTNWDLNDIERIEVIRGPGSVTYGPGAISAVINIVTKTPQQLNGVEVNLKYMYPYNSKMGAISYAKKWEDVQLYFHFSTTDTDGQNDPKSFNMEGTLANGFGEIGSNDFLAGSPKSFDQHNFMSDFEDTPQFKAHLDLTFFKEFRLWMRFTNSGGNMDQRVAKTRYQNGFNPDGTANFGSPEDSSEIQNRQFTVQFENTHVFSDFFALDTALSWDFQDYERRRRPQLDYPATVPADIQHRINNRNSTWNKQSSHGEGELFGRVLARLKPHEHIQASLGAEYSYDRFGAKWGGDKNDIRQGDNLNYISSPLSNAFDSSGLTQNLGGVKPDQAFFIGDGWSTHTFSLLGEAQADFLPWFTVLVSARADKHRDTDVLLSPRVAILSEINKQHQIKFSWQQSVRMNTAEQLLLAHRQHEKSDPEKLNGYELSYEYTPLKRLQVNASTYYYELESTGFIVNSTTGSAGGGQTSFGQTSSQGIQRHIGNELEVRYSAQPFDFGVNHSFVKLLDFELGNGVRGTSISYSDYNELPDGSGRGRLQGTGNDLANWSNHSTKLFFNYRFHKDFVFHMDARCFYGMDGSEDGIRMIEKAVRGTADDTPQLRSAIRDLEKRDVWGADARLNLSLTYNYNERFSVSLQGQNVLGLNDNKRYQHEIGIRTLVPRAFYTEEPATFGIQVKLKF